MTKSRHEKESAVWDLVLFAAVRERVFGAIAVGVVHVLLKAPLEGGGLESEPRQNDWLAERGGEATK
jgi:hypothetical protein